MNYILFNQFGRLRCGWRILIYLIPFFISYVVIFAAILAYKDSNVDKFNDFLRSNFGILVYSTAAFFAAAILALLCGKILEDLPFKALGIVFNKTWLKDFLLGLLLGILTLCLAVFLAFPMSGISLSLNQFDSFPLILQTFASSFLVFFIAAAFEEVLFRGYVLQTLFRANLAWFGIILTSIGFAYVHNGNPSANYFSFINTLIAGVWFGIAYLKTRSLWLAFGLHLSWNWFQGAFFGINVSGLSHITPNPLFNAKIAENLDWLTGGNYGIEGGITCTIAIIFSTIFIYFLPILKPTKEMLALTSHENPTK